MCGVSTLCHLAITVLICTLFSCPAQSQQSILNSPSRMLLDSGSGKENKSSEDSFVLLAASSARTPDLPTSMSGPTVISAQDFNQVVLPITTLKFLGVGVEAGFGTGFCLDPRCRFIVTNYHIAMMAQPHKINGEKILERYVATGPDDEGATLNDGPYLIPLKFNLSRDLAIFELQHPLSKYRGATFRLDDLPIGQPVDIYSFPKESSSPLRHLEQFHGSFEGRTPAGLLGFHYNLSAGHAIRPGASGGIVVDSSTQQIVGVLSEVANDGQPIALAVSMQSLAEFVSKVQPSLAPRLFSSPNEVSSLSRDFYPGFEPLIAGECKHRPEESEEVKVLRSKAQLLADGMRNFIAIQTFSWGSGNNSPSAESAYEVRVLGGFQRFREFPDGTKELQDVPFPRLNTALVPGGEWSQLPEMVGTELRLKIRQAADVVIRDKRIRVFQYRAEAEDNICRWKSSADFGLFAVNKIVSVACHGEVWTDEDGNILRMSERYELPGKWKDYQTVVTYGWLRRSDDSPRLIPLTISTQAEYKKKLYWCHGQFVNYMVFTSEARITSN